MGSALTQPERSALLEALEVAKRTLTWYGSPLNYHEDDWNVKGVVNPPEYGKPGTKARVAFGRIKRLTEAEHD
jgi:hypothetical protein